MQIFVCPSSVCLMKVCFELSILIFLAQVSPRVVSGLRNIL